MSLTSRNSTTLSQGGSTMTFKSARTIGVILSILLISLSTDPTWGQTNSPEESQQEPLSYLSLPLQPRSDRLEQQATASGQSRNSHSIPGMNESMVKMGGSLAIVLSLFLGLVWVTKRRRPRGYQLTNQTLEVIGQTPLSKNHTLHIVKLGQRLLLVSAGESEVTCLSEISDPVEIEQLLTSATTTLPKRSTFKSLFAQYDQDTNQLFTDP